MGWTPDHKPIREKYNPRMTAAEQRHKARVEQEPCYGCGSVFTVGHHTLLDFPNKRWRRDHDWLLPVCYLCHAEIHDTYGDETKWLASINREPFEAIEYMRGLHA